MRFIALRNANELKITEEARAKMSPILTLVVQDFKTLHLKNSVSLTHSLLLHSPENSTFQLIPAVPAKEQSWLSLTS